MLSFSLSLKEQKNKDPLASVRARLEPLDVKAIIPYIIGKTTHVVGQKRNTPVGLQALINAKYIVTNSFVDALVNATGPVEAGDGSSTSPLEEDFEAAWPDPVQYLPPRGQEPIERPPALFAPDPKRLTVFEGYTFVFCDRTQFERLQPPITNGSGKALLYKLEPGKTTVEDLVHYLKRIAGDTKDGELRHDGEGKAVVLVRFRGTNETEGWSLELGDQVAQALDQRLIEQSEFLDAILVNDASGLRRPLPERKEELTVIQPVQPTGRCSSSLVSRLISNSALRSIARRSGRQSAACA